jgi:hypothetical protein
LVFAVRYVIMVAMFHESWGMKISAPPGQTFNAFEDLGFSPGLVASMAHKVNAYAFTGPLPAVRDNDFGEGGGVSTDATLLLKDG